MTNNLITLTIPNDDHVALRAFGKALEEMALAHGAEPQAQTLVRERVGEAEIEYLTRDTVAERLRVATEDLQQAAPRMMQELRCEGDELQGKRKETTEQQVESLAGTYPGTPTPDATYETIAEKVTGHGIANCDVNGTPWDERIHSASKALNSDGTWRLRRKPKDMNEMEWSALVESVKAELAHAMESFDEQVIMEEDSQQKEQHSLADSEFVVDPYDTYEEGELPPVTPPGDDFHTDAGVVSEQTVAGIPPIPVPPPVVVPPVAVSDEQWDFPKLMKFLTERHGKIDVPTVNQLLAVDGLAALTDLNAHPDKIGPFVARVKAHLGE